MDDNKTLPEHVFEHLKEKYPNLSVEPLRENVREAFLSFMEKENLVDSVK